MPPVYVVQQGAKLRIHNQRLQIVQEQDDSAGDLASIPLGQVSQVVLFGNIGLTTPAIQTLLTREIEVVFLTESGGYRGRLVGSLTPHVPLRRAQYGRLGEPDFVLEMAKGFVSAKLVHQRALLQRHNRERDDVRIRVVLIALDQAVENVAHKTTLASLMGLEGSSTAAYFRGLRCLFDPSWGFEDRNRRPPRDPVNVLLSLGYTLLTNLASSAVQTVGLDPYAGFLHEIAYNRPALALDLVEEFRPVVDGIALWCLNGRQLLEDDFQPGGAERPVILSEAGLRKFVSAFEKRLEQKFTHPQRGMQFPMRQCLIEQARQVADRILHGPPGFTGMGFR